MATCMTIALRNALSSQLPSTQLEQIFKHAEDPATLNIMHEAANALKAAKIFTAAKELFNLT
jgi:hypothetical protein